MIATPPPDSFMIFCKGHCGRFIAIPITVLKRVLKGKSLQEFCDDFVCKECSTSCIILIESAVRAIAEETDPA